MQKDNYKIVKKIDIENKFSDLIYKQMRSSRFGMSPCCSMEELDNTIFERNVCDWQDSEIKAYVPMFKSERFTLPSFTRYHDCNAGYPTETPNDISIIPDWVQMDCEVTTGTTVVDSSVDTWDNQTMVYGCMSYNVQSGLTSGNFSPVTNTPVTNSYFTITLPSDQVEYLNGVGVTEIFIQYVGLFADTAGYNDEYYTQTVVNQLVSETNSDGEIVMTVYTEDTNAVTFTGAPPVGAILRPIFKSATGEYWGALTPYAQVGVGASSWDLTVPDPVVYGVDNPNITWTGLSLLTNLTKNCWDCADYVTGYYDRGACMECDDKLLTERDHHGCWFCGLTDNTDIKDSTCKNDSECITVIVKDQHGDLVKHYPVILDGKEIGKTNYKGEVYHEIQNAAKNNEHTLQSCFCFYTLGSCDQQLIEITVDTCEDKLVNTLTTACSTKDVPTDNPDMEDHTVIDNEGSTNYPWG
tara:strand:- start:4799 stop:6199 length:1401 start_codon:yes stop_codon:yes gene_type:complete